MTQESTLVLGATGKTGRRVLARLRLRKTPVRAASRSSETPFDWFDADTWDAALRGVAAAYLVPASVPGLMHDFVARAQDAGLRRLVLLSGRGADEWGDTAFGVDMRSAEDAVRASALEWTVLRPNNFDQNFDEEAFHAPVVAGELALPAGAVGEPFIDVEDVADVAARILAEPGTHAGRTYEMSGPRAITFDEAVDLIARASGRAITYREISTAEYTATLVAGGMDADDAVHLTAMYDVMARGVIAEPADGVEAVLGRTPRTFEDYVLRTAVTGAWDR